MLNIFFFFFVINILKIKDKATKEKFDLIKS
jgi:hypothetical protein